MLICHKRFDFHLYFIARQLYERTILLSNKSTSDKIAAAQIQQVYTKSVFMDFVQFFEKLIFFVAESLLKDNSGKKNRIGLRVDATANSDATQTL